MDCSLKNRKDVTRKQEEHAIYYTLINTSSRRAKRDGKCSYDVQWLQNAYNIVPQNLLLDCLKMYKIAEKVKIYWGNNEKLVIRIDNR